MSVDYGGTARSTNLRKNKKKEKNGRPLYLGILKTYEIITNGLKTVEILLKKKVSIEEQVLN